MIFVSLELLAHLLDNLSNVFIIEVSVSNQYRFPRNKIFVVHFTKFFPCDYLLELESLFPQRHDVLGLNFKHTRKVKRMSSVRVLCKTQMLTWNSTNCSTYQYRKFPHRCGRFRCQVMTNTDWLKPEKVIVITNVTHTHTTNHELKQTIS